MDPLIAVVPLTGPNLEQLIFNGLVAGTGYALVAVGFGLIIGVTGRFHIAFGAIFALTAFVTAQVAQSWGLPLAPAMILGIAWGVLIAVAIERLIYRPLDVKVGSAALLTIFIVSLGLSTAGEGGISLIWSQQSLNLSGFTTTEAKLLDVYTTNIALWSLFVGWCALLITWFLVRWTKLGRMIRAVRVNPPLSVLVGINPAYIYVAVFAIGTTLGGIDAVFVAANSTATPTMGDNPVLYAITVAFIARSINPLVLSAVAVGVGLVESLSSLVVQPQWSQVVIFGGLLLYVIGYAVRQGNGQSVLRRRRRPARHLASSTS